jgi:LAS superfamily LD-carboxypeptidase LdcB
VARRPAGPTAFAPVVTDRIPAPAVSIALSAPVPGLTNMQPSAARAFGRAFAAARSAGLAPQVRSAWRSRAYQQVLFDRAVTTYGSTAEAGKWVLSPGRSAHVKGYAVDVHPQAVAAWLEVHGPAYGICRTYDNEWWHFEYLATSHCPPRLPTAAG